MEKSPTLVLAILGQTNAPATPGIMHVASEALLKVLQAQNRDMVFSGLWKNSSAFLKKTMVAVYSRQPEHCDLIFSAAIPYLQNLLECDNIPFAVDLAIYAANERKGNFAELVASFVSKHGVSSIPKIVDYVRQKVTDGVTTSSSSVSDAILNSLFRHLSETGQSYPIEVRYFIQRAYQSCLNVRPKLITVTFDVKYSVSKLREIKQTASMNYSRLLEDDITPDEFLTQMT